MVGMDVILVKCPNPSTPGMIEIVVGHLLDYYFPAQDLPFGAAVMMGATRFSIDTNVDEYRLGRTAWTFSVKENLKEWAGALPAGIDFLETELPAGNAMEDIHGIIDVASVKPEMLTLYIEKAREFLEKNRDMPPPEE